MIARSNYYSIPASFLWSFGGSLMWEYFGEWREQVSLNDMIFTPTLGALTGEFFIQTGNFIESRMKPGFFRELILIIINPVDRFNRMLDTPSASSYSPNSNSSDMRVQFILMSPLQFAATRSIEKNMLHR
jgi:hypothetical protein